MLVSLQRTHEAAVDPQLDLSLTIFRDKDDIITPDRSGLWIAGLFMSVDFGIGTTAENLKDWSALPLSVSLRCYFGTLKSACS